jgi:hypothetical protein
MAFHARRFGLAAFLAVVTASPGNAGIYGVPTNLDADGTTSGTSVNPPGWFNLDGLGNGFPGGDGVHQMRLLIEVTGTTLDVRLFDPGTGGARDLATGTVSNTTYTLLDPAGTTLSSVTIGADVAATTDDRLARLTPPCGAAPASCGFFALNSGSANNRDFRAANGVAISPGLYELRVFTSGAGETDTNIWGVDVRQALGSTVHYNVFTLAADNGGSGAPVISGAGETAWLGGATDGGTAPEGNVTQPLTLYAFVDRGCSIQTSNFDMDSGGAGAGGSASVLDVQGASTALAISGSTTHSENTISIENTGATNIESLNYGMYRIANNTGTQNNAIDWRVSDFQGSTSAGANVPVQPINPIRMYLPNGYAPVAGNPNAVAPVEPILLTSARVLSGANPLVAGSTTRFTIATTVSNAGTTAVSNVQVTVGHQANQSNFSAPRGCVDGAGVSGCTSVSAATCTNGSAATFRRCTFATLAAGSVATMLFDVDFTPPASGLRNLTGAPAALPNTTTSNASFTPAYSSAAFPRTMTIGPVCNLVVDVGSTALLTRASIRGLRVSADRIDFATGSQRDTVSFDVYAAADAQGHGLTRLNAAPLRALVPSSWAPMVYSLAVGTKLPYVVIEEQDARGRRHRMGPFATQDAHLRAAFERVAARLDLAGASYERRGRGRMLSGRRAAGLAPRGEGRRRARPRLSSHGVSVAVEQAGTVEIALSDLEARGLPVANPRGLEVTTRGRGVPFEVVRGTAGRPEAIRFVAEALSTDFTGTNVYVVSRDDSPSSSVALSRSGVAPAFGFTRVKKSTIYLANAPQEEDPWFQDLLFGDGTTWPYETWDPTLGDFDLPDLAPGTAGRVPVEIRLFGRTPHTHEVSASINGAAVGTVRFQGTVAAVLRGTVPRSALQAAGNKLTLRYASSGPPDLGFVYLAHMDLKVPPSRTPRPVTAELGAFDPTLPRAAGVTYLVVSHPSFLDQARRLASLKETEGQQVAVVDVERVYDRFSAGIVEAEAVRAAIAFFRQRSPRLRYVLLVGDDTFDTRDDLGTGAVAYVPSLLCWDGEFGRVPCENRYADVDGDGRPDVSIGRLPVQTPQEADRLVDKIAQQGALRGRTGHLVGVDNQTPEDVSFRAAAEEALRPVAGGAPITWADVGEDLPTARERVREGLRSGVPFIHYFGHAGPELWADEALLTADDAAALSGSAPSVLFSWACESQWYQYLYGRTISEELLLAPGGGAVASLGPAGITDPRQQRELYDRVYRYFFKRGLTLGEAVRRAKSEALAADPLLRPVVEGWNLLGDPSIRATWAGADEPAPGPGEPPAGNDGTR